MRDWRTYWRARAAGADRDLGTELREVGKTVLGQPISTQQLDTIIHSILQGLELSPEDDVVDLGCGNGLITIRLAPFVHQIMGVDISAALIEAARERFKDQANVRLSTRDICDFAFGDEMLRRVTKVCLYEVAQHLALEELGGILSDAFNTGTIKRCFCGSIPDASRLERFYDTPERMELYRRNLALGREQIGHWWEIADIERIAHKLGIKVEIRPQDPILHTAHYRFDAIFNA